MSKKKKSRAPRTFFSLGAASPADGPGDEPADERGPAEVAPPVPGHCGECGGALLAGAAFCGECGTAIPESLRPSPPIAARDDDRRWGEPH